MEMNENKWNVNNLVREQHGRNEIESFYDNITIRPLGFVQEEGMEMNENNYFRIFFSSLVWEF